jgi:hypothetical protein
MVTSWVIRSPCSLPFRQLLLARIAQPTQCGDNSFQPEQESGLIFARFRARKYWLGVHPQAFAADFLSTLPKECARHAQGAASVSAKHQSPEWAFMQVGARKAGLR